MTPEGRVKAQAKRALEDAGWWYCMPVGTGYGRSGVPDIIACCAGRLVGIECKAGKGRTTALQDREITRIHAAGGLAFIVDETNVGILADTIKEMLC